MGALGSAKNVIKAYVLTYWRPQQTWKHFMEQMIWDIGVNRRVLSRIMQQLYCQANIVTHRVFRVFKSPLVTGGLIVLFRFRHRLRRRRRRSAKTFQLSTKTPEANFFKPHMVYHA